MSVDQDMPGAVFAPDAIRTINSAYRGALDVIERRPSLKNRMADQTVRVELAKAMLALARAGETDEGSLREKALIRVFVTGDPAN